MRNDTPSSLTDSIGCALASAINREESKIIVCLFGVERQLGVCLLLLARVLEVLEVLTDSDEYSRTSPDEENPAVKMNKIKRQSITYRERINKESF